MTLPVDAITAVTTAATGQSQHLNDPFFCWLGVQPQGEEGKR